MPMGGWTTYCPPYAAPRRMRRAVAPTACRSMPGVSDRPEKRFRYSAVAPGAVPLSGGGIDTLRRVVKPINASCAGRAGVDAYRVRPYGCLRPSRLIRPCEVQILTRSNLPPRSCRRRGRGYYKTGGGDVFMADPKISKQRAVVQGGWVLCPVTWAKIGALEKGAHGSGVAPYCPKCKASHPVRLKEP